MHLISYDSYAVAPPQEHNIKTKMKRAREPDDDYRGDVALHLFQVLDEPIIVFTVDGRNILMSMMNDCAKRILGWRSLIVQFVPDTSDIGQGSDTEEYRRVFEHRSQRGKRRACGQRLPVYF